MAKAKSYDQTAAKLKRKLSLVQSLSSPVKSNVAKPETQLTGIKSDLKVND